MYKRLIEQVVEQKAEEAKLERQQKSRQNMISNAKYKVDDIYVGYIARQITKNQNNGKTKKIQMIDDRLIVFKYISSNCMQDIETLKKYPLFIEGTKPNDDRLYISERYLDKLTTEYVDILAETDVKKDTLLTSQQLRKIIAKQQIDNVICF